MDKTTHIYEKQNIQKHVLDASGKVLGRLATEAAYLLMGKHKVAYSPHIDHGDQVTIINAAAVRLTGKKLEQKIYFHHSGYPGGDKYVLYKDLLDKHPEKAVRLAVKGMLPKNRLSKKMLRHLKIYRQKEI
jgi:large subunit ribosomal protein L13